ncbi:hypothetical protein vBKpnAMK4_00472 [Klebsiella phage vB_Kpn_AM_K4]
MIGNPLNLQPHQACFRLVKFQRRLVSVLALCRNYGRHTPSIILLQSPSY